MNFKKRDIKYVTDYFSLNIPCLWKIDISKFVYSFYDKNGRGVVQISTYSSKEKKIKINFEEELKRFTKIDINNLNIKKINKKDYSYVETDLLKDNTYWKIKIVHNNKLIAFITYNCKNNRKNDKEIEVVNKIFNSFKFL